MNSKMLAAVLAVLVVTVGGAAAVSGVVANDESALDTRDADIEASHDNGTVTATVTNGGEPVPNATVEIGDEEYTTDANGAVSAEIDADEDDVDIEVEAPGFEGEQEYAVVDGALLLEEEEFEYEVDDEKTGEEGDDAEEADDADDEREDDDAQEREEEEDDENDDGDDDDEGADEADIDTNDDADEDDGS